MGQMFYVAQASSDGTLSQPISLGPMRSSFEQLFCGGNVSVSVMQVDRSVLDLNSCGRCIRRLL